MTLHYRDAQVADAAGLAALFHECFCDTFGHLYAKHDLEAFLAGHTAKVWEEQLRDPSFAIRIVEDDVGLLGFAKLGTLQLPVQPVRRPVELRQFYVLKRGQGTGAASALMDWVMEEARRRSADELYLSVFTENHRARRFYNRFGFAEVGPYAFMVGNQADEDIIMKLLL